MIMNHNKYITQEKEKEKYEQILGIARAAVLRTYGERSDTHFLMASMTMGMIISILMLDSTRNARARIN